MNDLILNKLDKIIKLLEVNYKQQRRIIGLLEMEQEDCGDD